MELKINSNAKDVLLGKFAGTIAAIEGYHKEAKGDMAVNQTYRAPGVFSRMDDIRSNFYRELEAIINQTQVVADESR